MANSNNIYTPAFNMANVVNAKDSQAVEERFNEAHQGMMGMLMTAYKVRKQISTASENTLPLTIIGGFLGSGKTTLLNKLLTAPHGKRLVVLVNDFGKVNIDAELIASQTDDMINLSNGCACCSVSADLTDSLIKLSERDELPEAIVLEASGVADPHGIVQVANAIPAIRLDGGLAVVDVETLFTLAQDKLTGRLFHNQISAADLIVLTKVDLVDEHQCAIARQWLKDNYPTKKVVEALDGNVPPEIILGIETTLPDDYESPESTDHKHDFASVSFTFEQPISESKIRTLLAELSESLLRVKCVLNLDSEPSSKTIYQRVGQRDTYRTSEPWKDEKRHSSLVFIGPKGTLNKEQLETALINCLV
ncbi:GTP-binding protein [Shewanella sp. MMG014]|uniref:CobW family GTP-binding protein n=1 Tax=Shewanella sp. MMG014 TaxID=2822691 RepID=UPI001B35AB65|nr:GTP-binding protein [Shewanella sp. MMG014]MBQ4891401.1 GTP-binding protein [Shewanella sp. MMG014]